MPDFITVATVDELQPGDRMIVEIDGLNIAVFNVDNRYYAIQDECTHDGGTLAEGELSGIEIECPRHGGRFDITTGRATLMPASKPTRRYETRVEGGDVQVMV